MIIIDKDTTGRDKLILAKALVYAIGTIEKLPFAQQEWSDKEDMRRVLKQHFDMEVGGSELAQEPDFIEDGSAPPIGPAVVFIDDEEDERPADIEHEVKREAI